MYTFTIKDSSPDINVVVARSLLALAGIASLLYRTNQYYFINISAAAVLILAAFFAKKLTTLIKGNTIMLLVIAAVILFTATLSIAFAAVLVLCGVLVKKFNTVPIISINTKGITITKMLSHLEHQWSEFNNIILKDNLLTLDFKNNKLLQLSINESTVDEYSFNTFCSGFIGI